MGEFIKDKLLNNVFLDSVGNYIYKDNDLEDNHHLTKLIEKWNSYNQKSKENQSLNSPRFLNKLDELETKMDHIEKARRNKRTIYNQVVTDNKKQAETDNKKQVETDNKKFERPIDDEISYDTLLNLETQINNLDNQNKDFEDNNNGFMSHYHPRFMRHPPPPVLPPTIDNNYNIPPFSLDPRFNNRFDNRFDNRPDSRFDNRFDNRLDNRLENRFDNNSFYNKYENKFEENNNKRKLESVF